MESSTISDPTQEATSNSAEPTGVEELTNDLEVELKIKEEDEDPNLEEFSKEDYDFKIRALVSSFSEDMNQIVVNFREQQRVEAEERAKKEAAAKKSMRRSTKILNRADEEFKKDQQRLEVEALGKGVNMQLLRELKVAFEQKMTSTGGAGVDEEEFLNLFGPSLCRGKSEEETRHWFRAIDQNCSGSIQWEEVSNYLVNYHVYAEKIKTKQEDYFVAKPLEPKGTLTTRRHHHLPIHKILYSPGLDVLYSASNDGCVYAWNPQSLRATHVVHKSSEGVWVYDIALLMSSNRLIVLQSDRCFFMYDCFMSQDVLRHELLRVFATQGDTTKTFKDGSSYYECIDRSKVTGATLTIVDRSAVTERILPHMRPASLLVSSSVPIRCFDHVIGVNSGIGSGEPIVCGLENGTLEFYTLQMVTTAPIAPTMRIKSHKAMITKVKYAQELNGVISCSIDGTIVVTDIDIRQVVQRLVINDASIVRPQFQFEYKTYHNMLLSWTSRTLHVWNALTGARLTHLPDHEAPIVAASINVDRMIAYVLMENKVIRVWDLRNWRRVGEYCDETTRYCNNTLNFLLWNPRHHYLLCGCSELFALRPRDVQERIDAGLVPSNRKYVGHLHPIRDSKEIPFADHIVAIDTHDVGVWGVQTKKLLAMWKWKDPEDHVTCFAVAPDNVRIAVGTESGSLEMYNYACGFKIFSMNHDKPKTCGVTACLFMETSANGGPPSCFAAIGNSIFGWVTDRENEDDLDPNLEYHNSDPESIIWCLVCIDERRQTLAASFNNGEVQIVSAVSMVCNCTMAFHSPADRLLSSPRIPALFAAAHSDGTVRFYLYDSGMFNLYPLVGFHAAFANEEVVSCMTFMNDKLVVGDSVGTVSIFSLGPLLDRDYVWQQLMPNVSGVNFCHIIREEILPFVDLVVAFDSHESSVTSVSVVDGSLVTSGGDRFLRNWNLESYTLCVEYGTDNDQDAFRSFHVTNDHHFHACEVTVGVESETKTVGKMSRALSYAKRGSILAEEMHRVRVVMHERQQRLLQQQQQNGAPENDDEWDETLTEQEVVKQLTREPTSLTMHRRKMSTLVGDFVLRNNPNVNVALMDDAVRSANQMESVASDPLNRTRSSAGDGEQHHREETMKQASRKSLLAGKNKKKTGRASSETGIRVEQGLRATRSAIDWDVGSDEEKEDTEILHPKPHQVHFLPPIHNHPRNGQQLGASGHFSPGAVSPALSLRGSNPVSPALLSPQASKGRGALLILEGTPLVDEEEIGHAGCEVRLKSKRIPSKYRSAPVLSLTTFSPHGSASSQDGAPSSQRDKKSQLSSSVAKHAVKSGIMDNSMYHVSGPPKSLALYETPDEVDLFKIATDHVLKHQTTLVRTIPDKSMHSKLQEVMRIREERQEMNDQAGGGGGASSAGIFFRLPLLQMDGGMLGPTVNVERQSAFDILLADAKAHEEPTKAQQAPPAEGGGSAAVTVSAQQSHKP